MANINLAILPRHPDILHTEGDFASGGAAAVDIGNCNGISIAARRGRCKGGALTSGAIQVSAGAP